MLLNDQQQHKKFEPSRFLVFSASLRNDSLNTRLAKLPRKLLQKKAEWWICNMSEFDCPSFNQDLDGKGIIPDGATEFQKRFWQTMHS